jgi:Na+-driven multidrug efflux pump
MVNTVGLVLAVALNWYAATKLGLAGAALGTVIVMGIDRIVTLWRISRLTGVPISKLQDWKTLLLLALFAAGASLLAWAVKVLYFAHSGPLIRVMAGAAVLASSYVAVTVLSGTGRTWLAAVRTQKHGM